MATRLYVDSRTGKLAHAKPSTQPGIVIWYFDKGGKPSGRCMASTLDEFNARFKLKPRATATSSQRAAA